MRSVSTKNKYRKIVKILIIALLVVGFALTRPRAAHAACAAPSTDLGSASMTTSIATAGTYRVWSRIMAPDATNNSYLLEVDGGSCYVVGDSAIAANTWTWVSYQNGNTALPIDLTLSAGTHTLKMIGREAGVKLDRIILTTDTTGTSCNPPTGTGDTCAAQTDTTKPVTSISTPTNGNTVTGTVNVTATATDDTAVTKVEFYVDGVLKITDTTSPYSYSWDTTTAANSTHNLTTKAYDAANNVGTSTAVSVTVANTVAPQVSQTNNLFKGRIFSSTTGAYDTTRTIDKINDGIELETNRYVSTVGAQNVYMSVDMGAAYTLSKVSILWAQDTTKNYELQLSSDNVNWHAIYTGTGDCSSPPPKLTDYTTFTGVTTGRYFRVLAKDLCNTLFGHSIWEIGAYGTAAPSDTTPPVVNFTSPTDGAIISGTVSVTAAATDNVGVTKLEYYLDGVLKSTTTPYSLDTTTLSNGAHSLTAKAYDAAGNTSNSSVSVTVQNGDTLPPSVPVNLTANATAYNSVTLNWTAATDNVGVTGYYVVRGGVTIAQTNNVTTYTDTTVSASTSYGYQLIARDAAGNNSAASSTVQVTTPAIPDTQAPTAPTNLTAVAVSSSQINLTWTASTDNVGVSGYDVYRNGAKLASVTTTSFGDSGLAAGTTYSYYVIAHDGAGNYSSQSSTISATTSQPVANGTVSGMVTDAGSPLSGATVSVVFGGVKHSYKTSSTGQYLVSNIPPGAYSFTYAAKHYTSQTQTVTVTSGTTTTSNIILQHR